MKNNKNEYSVRKNIPNSMKDFSSTNFEIMVYLAESQIALELGSDKRFEHIEYSIYSKLQQMII